MYLPASYQAALFFMLLSMLCWGSWANTRKLWIYDLRTNIHFTLKENTLKRSDLDDFVTCYNVKNRTERKERERFKAFDYDELVKSWQEQ